MIRRLRQQDGIGLIELVIALGVLNIAILAMFSMFTAGTASIARANRTSSAAVVAEKQMELYRALLYKDIGLFASSVSTAASDATHTSETTEWNAGTQVTAATCTAVLVECLPIQTSVTGPDGNTYRVDSYIRTVTPTGGRAAKRVTVLVRRANDAKIVTRLTSSFDLGTGCVPTSTTAGIKCS